MKLLSHVRLLVTLWIVAFQVPLSMGFSRQEYWSGVPLPSPPQDNISCTLKTFNNFKMPLSIVKGFPGGSDGKESTSNVGDLGSIPGSGRSPGEGNGTPLQYSCLENPMDGGAWWATVQGVIKSLAQL